jgi:hypothetical protein
MAAARTSSKMLPLALVALALCGTFVAFGRCQVNFGLCQPKKPPGPYFLFAAENRARISENLGTGHSVAEVAKELGKEWQALSADAKADIQKRAAELKATYQAELEEFLAAGGVIAKKPKKAKKAKEPKDPNAPKRPLSGYMLWMQDNRPSFVSSLPKGDQKKVALVAKIAGERWAEVSDDVKAEYKQKSDKLKVAHEKELAAYKASLE